MVYSGHVRKYKRNKQFHTEIWLSTYGQNWHSGPRCKRSLIQILKSRMFFLIYSSILFFNILSFMNDSVIKKKPENPKVLRICSGMLRSAQLAAKKIVQNSSLIEVLELNQLLWQQHSPLQLKKNTHNSSKYSLKQSGPKISHHSKSEHRFRFDNSRRFKSLCICKDFELAQSQAQSQC